MRPTGPSIRHQRSRREPTLADDAAFRRFDIEREQELFEERVAQWDRAHPRATPTQVRWGRPRNPVELHLRVGNNGWLFNGKVAPLVPFTIRGVVWYQGENNVWDAGAYRHLLPLLVEDWRRAWGAPDLPFAWVQLPGFRANDPQADWPGLRDAQRRSLEIPGTGMAVTIDVGDPMDIHPRRKRPVGERLAKWALAEVYGGSDAGSGPLYRRHWIEGGLVFVEFDHVHDGLRSREASLSGFEIRDEEGRWHPAKARIIEDRIAARALDVERATGLRYAWSDDPPCSLYNGRGLPASPFVTDEPAPREARREPVTPGTAALRQVERA